VAQQPAYPDAGAHEEVVNELRQLPPLVSIGEVERLKTQLAEAALGHRFVLQGGDCAERIQDCNQQAIIRKLQILLQMSLVLTYGGRRPVTRLGRIAGQFAKPRSKDTEVVNGVELPVYRGDNVNELAATAAGRQPDPARLKQGYFSSAATLNFIRALLDGGFANLRSPEAWRLDFIPDKGEHAAYREIADRIRDTIDYFESLGPLSRNLREVDFFTSHEGLLLPYEEALTRQRSGGDRRWFNLGTHFLWIGERTRQLDGAHVEYFRGLANPIGVKLGGSATPEEVLRLAERLDPHNEPGRLTLITRYGVEAVEKHLPGLARALKREGRVVVFSCDPMHGNTISVNGVKTREYRSIVRELTSAFEIHSAEGTHLGGVHFELTGDNVTECIGGLENLAPADLSRSYETGCDPRLNYAQSIEMAFLISSLFRRHRAPPAPPQPAW
jgi:3-deoxy-7-phosphoheptulonate synthase